MTKSGGGASMFSSSRVLSALIPVSVRWMATRCCRLPRFACNGLSRPPMPKNNVSVLHPAHVDYVMALGDSITAAFAARSNLDEARASLEHRCWHNRSADAAQTN